MAKSPAFQFYPTNWLSSQKISLMTPAEEGAYIRLLCYCWEDEDCSLPDDDQILSRISRLGEEWFRGSSNTLRKCFVLHPKKENFLTNIRLLQEKEKQKLWREKSKSGGKKSAKTRWGKGSKGGKGGYKMVISKNRNLVEPNCNSMFMSLSVDKEKEDIKNISSKKKKKPDKINQTKTEIILPNFLDEKDWEEFIQHRKSIKAPLSDIAKKRAINELTKLQNEGHDAAIVINQTIVNGWKGLFPVNSFQKTGNANGKPETNADRHWRLSTRSIQKKYDWECEKEVSGLSADSSD